VPARHHERQSPAHNERGTYRNSHNEQYKKASSHSGHRNLYKSLPELPRCHKRKMTGHGNPKAHKHKFTHYHPYSTSPQEEEEMIGMGPIGNFVKEQHQKPPRQTIIAWETILNQIKELGRNLGQSRLANRTPSRVRDKVGNHASKCKCQPSKLPRDSDQANGYARHLAPTSPTRHEHTTYKSTPSSNSTPATDLPYYKLSKDPTTRRPERL
jgi:hypothetical protein